MSQLGKQPGHRHARGRLERLVYLNLLKTADVLERDLLELLKPAGLRPTQYNVLRILRIASEGLPFAANGKPASDAGLACNEIAARMLTRDPDLTRLLDRLEQRGLVARRRKATDRRVVCTTLTAAGHAILIPLDHPIAEMHVRQLSHMDPRRLRQLRLLLRQARQPHEHQKESV